MAKNKITISIGKHILDVIDSKIDGSVIRSRSQAIEFFLKKGLQDSSITTAVILLKGDHQRFSLQKVPSGRNKTLLKMQIEFFQRFGIRDIRIVTQHTPLMNDILHAVSDAEVNVEVINTSSKGNAEALVAAKGRLDGNFVVMSGDTYNNFDMAKMIKKHNELDKLVTMGLMTREKPTAYGTAVLDGDLIVDFREKSKHYSTNIVNAGIYIFNNGVFEMFDSFSSLEKDLFPKLAKIKQLAGFFTYGDYMHFGE